MILHGLTGSSRSPYVVGLQSALHAKGVASVALNFRGCSGTPNRTWRAYHSGETGDLRFVLDTLRTRAPERPLYIVGYSLGGNVVLKCLGETGHDALVEAAVAVSVPLRLDLCATRLDRGLSKIYRHNLITELKDFVKTKRLHLRQLGRVEDARRIEALGDLKDVRSFWDYDDRVVARLYGFEDAHDYYRKSSSFGYLKTIEKPTLLIQAEDDPFLLPTMIPGPEDHSAAVVVDAPKAGGHVGFVGGSPWSPHYWLEHRILQFLEERGIPV